jgi:UDP-N-acetylmuramoyl-L-alanyl-D-glutamate--2,6-diaminopimelate ligase
MLEKILNLVRKLIPRKIFRIFQPAYHFILAVTGNIIYRFPGRRIICVGVTGTNGKSTTCDLVTSVLKESGSKVGMISTVAIEIGGVRTENTTNRTTLGRWKTQKLLRKMVKAGCKYAVIEVASEGIAWFRTWGIPFDVAVFTNLSPEHLNFHKTMKNYRNTKGKLFANLSLSKKKKGVPKVSIVNADDKEAGYFNAFPADQKILFGIKKGTVLAKNVKNDKLLEFDIVGPYKNVHISSDLLAKFNTYNILAAFAVGASLGMDVAQIKLGIEKVKSVKGRFEKVAVKKGVSYFIDYAVTPDAFELLFDELRQITKGRVISVFGATGDRDKEKRPKLAAAAAAKTDIVIITDEEPYSEDPKKIIDEVAAGVPNKTKAKIYKILDRKKALKKAIELATSGDTVVATGLGHQKYRNIGGNKKILWHEDQVIKDLLK